MEILLLEKDFIEWSNPDVIIKRAEALFQNHSIITDCIKGNLQLLNDSKRIRNAIAHGSEEAMRQFIKVLNRHLGTIPIVRKTPGWFLNQNIKTPSGIIKMMTHFTNSYYSLSHYFI